MRKYILFFIYSIILINSAYTQDFTSNGARSQSLANSTGASIDFWNIIANPSTTAFLQDASIGIDVRNNFMIKELSTATLAILYPINDYSNFGFSLQRFGYSSFNENRISFSYSRKLSESTSASIQPHDNIQVINGDEYSSTEHEVGFNIGFFTKLNDQIHIASYYDYQKNITKADVDNVQQLSLALSWFPVSNLNFMMGISKKTNFDLGVSGGIEYKILNRISARVGISSEPFNVSMGIGILFETINIDISASHNQYLGMTSDISGNYIFRKQ